MLIQYLEYSKGLYTQKKYYITKEKVRILQNILSKKIIKNIIKYSYEKNIINYSDNWINNPSITEENSYILCKFIGKIDNIESKIIFDKKWYKYTKDNYIRCNIITSNNQHFNSGNIKLLSNNILQCYCTNNGIKHCNHTIGDDSKIILLYKKQFI